jgi:hypothetical protein
MTKVFNMKTGELKGYSCPPSEAVVCAFEQEKKNFNTWQYDYSQAEFAASGESVSCGDWAAKIQT